MVGASVVGVGVSVGGSVGASVVGSGVGASVGWPSVGVGVVAVGPKEVPVDPNVPKEPWVPPVEPNDPKVPPVEPTEPVGLGLVGIVSAEQVCH